MKASIIRILVWTIIGTVVSFICLAPVLFLMSL